MVDGEFGVLKLVSPILIVDQKSPSSIYDCWRITLVVPSTSVKRRREYF
jgi:hypothetical protein